MEPLTSYMRLESPLLVIWRRDVLLVYNVRVVLWFLGDVALGVGSCGCGVVW